MFIILSISFVVVRFFILKKKSLAILLFADAVKAENKGNYQEATNSYENALHEVNKRTFHRYLKIKIMEKLKLLDTIKTYKSDQSFVRKNNSWIN
jgi:hypothetical protein